MATYALIPSGGGDPCQWHRLVPELEALGHDAIAVRLPAEDDTAGWSEYADAVADAVVERDQVIVVGASMGGFTAPIVCTRRPVELLVLLKCDDPGAPERPSRRGGRTPIPAALVASTTPISVSRLRKPRMTRASTTTTSQRISARRRSLGRGRANRRHRSSSPGRCRPGPPSRLGWWLAGLTGCSRSDSSVASPASGSASRSTRSTVGIWSP